MYIVSQFLLDYYITYLDSHFDIIINYFMKQLSVHLHALIPYSNIFEETPYSHLRLLNNNYFLFLGNFNPTT